MTSFNWSAKELPTLFSAPTALRLERADTIIRDRASAAGFAEVVRKRPCSLGRRTSVRSGLELGSLRLESSDKDIAATRMVIDGALHQFLSFCAVLSVLAGQTIAGFAHEGPKPALLAGGRGGARSRCNRGGLRGWRGWHRCRRRAYLHCRGCAGGDGCFGLGGRRYLHRSSAPLRLARTAINTGHAL